MIITLPKLNMVGQYKMTAIVNAHEVIAGFEPTTIQLPNGTTFEGTKVYMDKGKFKVFCSPAAFGEGMMKVLAAAESVKSAIKSGSSLPSIAPIEVAPLALPSGKKGG